MRNVVKPPRRACMMTAVPRPATREGLESTLHRGRPQRLHPARRRSSAVLPARSLGAAFRSQPRLCLCVASCPPPSHRADEALTDAAVHRRPRGKLFVDYLYLESILGPDLRRIFATDTVQLGMWPFMSFGVCNAVALVGAAAPALSEAWPTARAAQTLAAHGVACSGQRQGHAAPVALPEDLWSTALPGGAPYPFSPRWLFARTHARFGAACPQGGALPARVV